MYSRVVRVQVGSSVRSCCNLGRNDGILRETNLRECWEVVVKTWVVGCESAGEAQVKAKCLFSGFGHWVDAGSTEIRNTGGRGASLRAMVAGKK